MRKFVSATIVSLALAASAAFASAQSEVVIAATHAGFAAKGGDLAAVHMHMHHALNCLVGPGGKGFDTHALNPCAHAGNGAIPDEKSAATKKSLEAVVGELDAGIAETDYAKAKAIAAKAEAMLKKD